jgi:PIN domain nuclease of toxin-antitoxin system
MINEADNDVIVSVVSLWEIVIKVRVGKLQADLGRIEQILDQEGVSRLGVSSAHLQILSGLPFHHRDPFDHLLIAQAIGENATFLTSDRQASLYPVKVYEAWRA